MNENIGEVKCPFCATGARVRKNVKGKLYFSCPDCGLIQGTGRTFLAWVADHARMYGPDGEPVKDTASAEAKETAEAGARAKPAPAGQPAPVEVKTPAVEVKKARGFTGPDLL